MAMVTIKILVPDGAPLPRVGDAIPIPEGTPIARLNGEQKRALFRGRRLVGMAELARRCGVDRRTAHRWIAEGLPVVRRRGRSYVEDGQARAWLQRSRPVQARAFFEGNPMLPRGSIVAWRPVTRAEGWRNLLQRQVQGKAAELAAVDTFRARVRILSDATGLSRSSMRYRLARYLSNAQYDALRHEPGEDELRANIATDFEYFDQL